jgi:hypothetical protein
VCHCLELAHEDMLEVTLKSDFTYIHALGMGKDTEGTLSVFGGKGLITRILRRICARANNNNFYHMFIVRSIYESKRCWEELPANLEKQAMHKHKRLLSEPQHTDEATLRWIDRAVDLVVRPDSKYEVPNLCPTYHAGINAPCNRGGNHGLCSPDFEISIGQINPIDKQLEEMYLRESLSRKIEARYQALPEPGKFRIITVGESWLYSGLRGIQKFLLEQWSKCPWGTFVPDLNDHIVQRVGRGDGNYVSGDYSSATDNMHLDVTLRVVDRIMKNINMTDTLLHERLLASFRDNEILYPDNTRIQQQNGQLMGHPVSFPILCIINLSTYLRTFHISEESDLFRDYTIDQLYKELESRPFLINGDDILFRGNHFRYADWRRYAGKVGLVVNEPKTYVNKSFSLINSVLTHMPTGRTVPYYHLALAKAHQVKSEPVRMLTTMSDIDDFLNKIRNLDEFLWKKQRRIMLKSYSDLFAQLTKKCKSVKGFRPNYFLPKEVGGLGLTDFKSEKLKVTRVQRQLATYLIDHPEDLFLKEKIGCSYRAVERAVEQFSKIRPQLKSLVDYDFKTGQVLPIEGPIRKGMDPDIVNNDYLSRCLLATQYLKGKKDNCNIFRVLNPKHFKNCHTLYSKEEVRGYKPVRQSIFDRENFCF